MSNPFTFARQRSLPGAKLYFRLTATSTPQDTYTTPDLGVANSNPVVADADGYFDPIYLDPSLPNYRIIHTDGSNVDDDPTLELELEPTVDDYPSSSNVSSQYRVKGTRPRITIEETDASSNAKKWYVEAQAETLVIGKMDDAEATLVPLLTLDRTHVIQVTPLISSDAPLDISTLLPGHSAYIVKATDTIRTSNVTQTLDPALQFTNAPAGTYSTQGALIFVSPTAAEFALAWPRIAAAAGIVAIMGFDSLLSPVGAPGGLLMSSTVQVYDTTVNIVYYGNVQGVETATTGQTLGPTWAQSVSSGGNTKVLAGSWLRVTRLT